MLACRACRINLSATEGCDLCNPIRKHLVVVGEDENERPSLSATGGEVVSALRHQLKHIRGELKINPTDTKMETRLIAVGNTLAKILESARKIQQDGISAVENMSFAERANLFITWISDLTPGYRTALREKWDQWELETSAPVNLLSEKSL